jgi:hypothetical protein
LQTVSNKASSFLSRLTTSEAKPKAEKKQTEEKRKLILKSPEKLFSQVKSQKTSTRKMDEPETAKATDRVSSEDMAKFLLKLHENKSEAGNQPRLRLDKLAELAEKSKKEKAVSGLEKEFLKELTKRKLAANK